MNEEIVDLESSIDSPVTVSISRKILPGHVKEFEEWEKGIIDAASRFPGYLGTNVIKPRRGGEQEYVTIYRFATYEQSKNWEDSEERKDWLDKAKDFVVHESEKQRVTGLEAWFSLPEVESTKHAPRYKMAIVLTIILYILAIVWEFILGPPIENVLPWAIKVLVIIVTNVLLITYLIMPTLTRILKNWLFED